MVGMFQCKLGLFCAATAALIEYNITEHSNVFPFPVIYVNANAPLHNSDRLYIMHSITFTQIQDYMASLCTFGHAVNVTYISE